MRKTFNFAGGLAYLVLTIFLLNAFLVAAETQQVRVIDKILVKPVTDTETFKTVISPFVSGDYVTWMEYEDKDGNSGVPNVYLKNLKTDEVERLTDNKIRKSFADSPAPVHDNYVFGVDPHNVYDVNKDEYFDINISCPWDYDVGNLFFFCSDGLKIYDLEKKEVADVIDKINGSDPYGGPYGYPWASIKIVDYPYVLLGRGVYNIETNEFKKVKISNARMDGNYLITHLAEGDALIDIRSGEIISYPFPAGVDAGYSVFRNGIILGVDKNEIKLFNLNTGKEYRIETTINTNFDHIQFDGNTIVWTDHRNKNKFPLSGDTNTDIYMARLNFKYMTVEVNETKFPLKEERTEEPVTIVEEDTGIALPSLKANISGCIKDSQCEAGVCNIETGYCVECYKGSCNCQEDYKPCFDDSKCVKLNSKKAGDYYDCEFECQSGLGKGGQCIDPITISLSTTKKTVGVGDGTDVTISFDNALDYPVETDLTITSGDGVSISSSEACQTGSRNLCKSFHKIGAKEVKQLSIRIDCIDTIKNTPISGKITYTAGSLSTTVEKTLEIDCVKASIVQENGFFAKLFAFLKGVFS